MIFLAVAAVFALGSLVQTIAGFGSAVVIMPILTQFLGVQTASTVMAFVGATVVAAVLYQNRQGLRWREAARLLSGSVIGIPLGTLALKELPAAPVVAFLGIVLLVYAGYGFATAKGAGTRPENPDPARDATLAARITSGLVGLCAGLLGGAYATDGPPLVIYGSIKRWPKDSFRSILQACFLVDGVLIVLCHGAGGLVTREVFIYCLYGLPGMAAGLGIGTLLDRRIDHALFHRVLLWLILILGAGLMARAFFSA